MEVMPLTPRTGSNAENIISLVQFIKHLVVFIWNFEVSLLVSNPTHNQLHYGRHGNVPTCGLMATTYLRT